MAKLSLAMTKEITISGLSANKPAGWVPLSETNCLILVGVTGVGKSTTVDALAQAGLSFSLLPNRRTITDHFMIQFLQEQAGEPIAPVTDRAARFDYTRRYREQFAGGMGHTIASLTIDPQEITTDWLIFDGLRGQNEVQHAADVLPNARFLVLEAPDTVRVQRLLGRNDAFDKISGLDTGDTDLTQFKRLFGDDGVRQLEALVDSGKVELDTLMSKIAIVQKERENYDPFMTKMALRHDAPERTICVDTSELSAAQAATATLEKLNR